MTYKRRECQRCGRNRAERFYSSAKGRVCETCRRNRARKASKMVHQLNTYGLTEDEYAMLLAAQSGRCAICLGLRRGYDTDHDHKLQADGLPVRDTLRGLLCPRCNRKLLPAGLDDPNIFRRAADYLESPPARALLERGTG